MTQVERARIMLTTTPGVVTDSAMRACGIRNPKDAVRWCGVRVVRVGGVGWRAVEAML